MLGVRLSIHCTLPSFKSWCKAEKGRQQASNVVTHGALGFLNELIRGKLGGGNIVFAP
jgi:hypothetical protein